MTGSTDSDPMESAEGDGPALLEFQLLNSPGSTSTEETTEGQDAAKPARSDQRLSHMTSRADAQDATNGKVPWKSPGDDGESLYAKDVKADLERLLEATEGKGCPVTTGTFPHATLPGLKLERLGTIGLRLPDRDANAIKSVSHEPHDGKGEDIISDGSARNTCEVSADMI